MTAPQTPPDDQPPNDQPSHGRPHDDRPPGRSYDPWAGAAGASAADPTTEGTAVQDRAAFRRELREAALIALVVTVCGALLGALWAWLAPHVPLIADARGNVYLKNSEGEESIGGDGTFVLLALGFGVLCAAAAFLYRKGGGIPLVVALTVGGLLGSVVAWRLGMVLGPTSDLVARAAEVGKGVTFDAPLRLQAKGALLAWPVAAMVTHLLLTGLFGPRDPEPPEPDWATGPHQAPPPPPAPSSSDG
ncbi:ABC transporter permease [Streptomyces sp. NPDC018019]|uniref:ABC transporter permease n=1 Tax=Streptomyces sp. NPDC018019 TaxID=3365030 RepID=UPI0037B0F492